MTPIGHISVSYLAGAIFRKIYIPAVIFGGIIADIDFLFFAFSSFNKIHRIVTHNLLFILIISAAGSLFPFKNIRRKTIFISILMGGLLHLFIDSVMDNNPTNGIGVALFWPFSEFMFSPFNILSIDANFQGWDHPLYMFKALIKILYIEIPFFLAGILMLYKRKIKNND